MLFGSGLQSRLARILYMPVRTATKRASGGKSANNKTAGRRLGPKKGEGEFVEAGQIIWRQRGTKWYPGENAGVGRDHTIFAKEPGYVRYYRDPFHAKRRFIGIALGHDLRLPTPHFEPRRRRFGYTVIDNPEVAEFEQQYLTRKETKRALALADRNAEREAARARRNDQYRQVLSAAGVPEVADRQLDRLDSIYQFMRGGMTFGEARDTVDSLAREDIAIACRTTGRAGEAQAEQLEAYTAECRAVDAAVAFGPLARLAAVAELAAPARDRVVADIAALTEPHLNTAAGTPSEVVDQVNSLLASSPAISDADATRLRKQYLRRPSPVVVTPESKTELEKRAKNGEGQIQAVWDASTSGVKRYFVPTGAKLIFA